MNKCGQLIDVTDNARAPAFWFFPRPLTGMKYTIAYHALILTPLPCALLQEYDLDILEPIERDELRARCGEEGGHINAE